MGVGLRLLAVEYCLKYSIAPFVNSVKQLTLSQFDIKQADLNDFAIFCFKMEAAFSTLIPHEIDRRKQQLFSLVYATEGSLRIEEYAEKSGWGSRQINRYFKEWIGISLKTYCSILRFKASISQIQKGKLFPEQNYSDQPHFIKEVKKFTGVTPKELFKRQGDKFIQISIGE